MDFHLPLYFRKCRLDIGDLKHGFLCCAFAFIQMEVQQFDYCPESPKKSGGGFFSGITESIFNVSVPCRWRPNGWTNRLNFVPKCP